MPQPEGASVDNVRVERPAPCRGGLATIAHRHSQCGNALGEDSRVAAVVMGYVHRITLSRARTEIHQVTEVCRRYRNGLESEGACRRLDCLLIERLE